MHPRLGRRRGMQQLHRKSVAVARKRQTLGRVSATKRPGPLNEWTSHMKKILLSSVALLGLTVGATAADLPRRVARVPYVPLPPAFTWTGFYLGVNAGYGFSNRNDDDPCFNGNFAFNGFGTCRGTNLNSLLVPTF